MLQSLPMGIISKVAAIGTAVRRRVYSIRKQKKNLHFAGAFAFEKIQPLENSQPQIGMIEERRFWQIALNASGYFTAFPFQRIADDIAKDAQMEILFIRERGNEINDGPSHIIILVVF